MLIEISGIKAKIIFDENRNRPEKSEVSRLIADNQKIINNTDWKPFFSLKVGLSKTYMWVKNNLEYFKDINYRM